MTRTVPGSAHLPWSPINRYGDGAAPMPKGWKNPLRQPLFQVMVEDREDGLIPVSPAMIRDTAELVLHACKLAIRQGHRKNWANAHLRLHSLTA